MRKLIARTTLTLLAVGALLALLTVVSPRVLAHQTGHESRSVEDCEKLPGTADAGERGQCLKCVQRSIKHHYHPDYPSSERCRPDNGKP
jgi:hypothetical protein